MGLPTKQWLTLSDYKNVSRLPNLILVSLKTNIHIYRTRLVDNGTVVQKRHIITLSNQRLEPVQITETKIRVGNHVQPLIARIHHIQSLRTLHNNLHHVHTDRHNKIALRRFRFDHQQHALQIVAERIGGGGRRPRRRRHIRRIEPHQRHGRRLNEQIFRFFCDRCHDAGDQVATWEHAFNERSQKCNISNKY